MDDWLLDISLPPILPPTNPASSSLPLPPPPQPSPPPPPPSPIPPPPPSPPPPLPSASTPAFLPRSPPNYIVPSTLGSALTVQLQATSSQEVSNYTMQDTDKYFSNHNTEQPTDSQMTDINHVPLTENCASQITLDTTTQEQQFITFYVDDVSLEIIGEPILQSSNISFQTPEPPGFSAPYLSDITVPLSPAINTPLVDRVDNQEKSPSLSDAISESPTPPVSPPLSPTALMALSPLCVDIPDLSCYEILSPEAGTSLNRVEKDTDKGWGNSELPKDINDIRSPSSLLASPLQFSR